MPRIKLKKKGERNFIGEIDYNIETISKALIKSKQLRLNLIYLEIDYRGKGYGEKIMNHIIQTARNYYCKQVLVNLTNDDYDYISYDKRKKFFEKFGFIFDHDDLGSLRIK